jgi:hypothetical protein
MSHRTLVPSKRLRNWHRQSGDAGPLKRFARTLVDHVTNGSEPTPAAREASQVALAWRVNKRRAARSAHG